MHEETKEENINKDDYNPFTLKEEGSMEESPDFVMAQDLLKSDSDKME